MTGPAGGADHENGVAAALWFDDGETMDPTQIRILLAMGLMSLLFAAQIALQTGGLVALP